MNSKRGGQKYPLWGPAAAMQQGIVQPGVMHSGLQSGIMPPGMPPPGYVLPGMQQFGGESTPNSDDEEEEDHKKSKRGRSSSRGVKRRRRAEAKEKRPRKRGKRRSSMSSPSESESGGSSVDEDTITDDQQIRRQCKQLGVTSKKGAYSLAGRFDIVKTCLQAIDLDLLNANRISLCVQSVVRARHPTHVREPLAFSLSLPSLSLSLRRTGPGIVGPDPVRRPAPSQPPKGRFVETIPGTGPGD